MRRDAGQQAYPTQSAGFPQQIRRSQKVGHGGWVVWGGEVRGGAECGKRLLAVSLLCVYSKHVMPTRVSCVSCTTTVEGLTCTADGGRRSVADDVLWSFVFRQLKKQPSHVRDAAGPCRRDTRQELLALMYSRAGKHVRNLRLVWFASDVDGDLRRFLIRPGCMARRASSSTSRSSNNNQKTKES